LRFKAFITVFIIGLAISNAHAVTLNVDITNVTRGEKMSEYPFSVIVSGSSAGDRAEKGKTLNFRTNADGSSQITLPVEKKKLLTIEVNYRGTTYRSRTIEATEGMEQLSLPVPVYDISDRKEDIAITERLMTLYPRSGRVLQVFERLKIVNSGNTTYVGKFNNELDLNQILYIPMPAGYVLSSYQGISDKGAYTRSSALVSRSEITPGTHEISLNYHVISDTGFFDLSLFTQKDAPEIRYLTLYFLQEDNWKIKLSGLKPAGEHIIGKKTYSAWKGLTGSASRITVYGPAYRNTSLFWTAIIIVLMCAALSALYFSRGLLRSWNAKREKERLESILADAEEDTSDTETGTFYPPFIRIINSRLKDLEQRTGT
jgi:hypothetical protein